eukprot:2449618-Amphidinium_carterae.1
MAVGIEQGAAPLRDDRAECRRLVLPIKAFLVRAFRWEHELPAHPKLERGIAKNERRLSWQRVGPCSCSDSQAIHRALWMQECTHVL